MEKFIHEETLNILTVMVVFFVLKIAQYIGEMCRYLLAAPSRPEDTDHTVRVVLGNGMGGKVWEEFVERFKISRVVEFYGSSEGNTNIGKNFYLHKDVKSLH